MSEHNPQNAEWQSGMDVGVSSSATTSLPIGPTGRSIVVMRPGPHREKARSIANATGLEAVSSLDFGEGPVSEADIGGAGALMLEEFDICIVNGDPMQTVSLNEAATDAQNPVLSVEPEMYVIPFSDVREYLRGYGDGVQALITQLLKTGEDATDAAVQSAFADNATHTWGLQATKVDRSLCTGAGIRVAVLDTGVDLNHPDFSGRGILAKSFVEGDPSAQDHHGHGTHCVGTSCGPLAPAGGTRRYGVAHQATILVGKVLSNSGSGKQGWVLAGINWAIQNKAAIISMSLGSPVVVGGTFSPAYEKAALAALNAGCLLIAAAGNEGHNPVGSPANCPSAFAVAAVGSSLQRASFSCVGLNPNGGDVNIAAPGVNVFSSVPLPTRYGMKSGTSMATPHVAGIAALWAQTTGLRGKALWQKLTSSTQSIGQTSQLIGAGLAQAP